MAHLDHVIARNVAELREERGWSQKDLAFRMSVNGLRWSPNRVSQLETLRRSVSVLEALALAWVFGEPIQRLLSGDEEIELPDASTVPLELLRDVVAGEAQEAQREQQAVDQAASDASREELRKLAAQVELKPEHLDALAQSLWSRPFVDERDRRADVPTDVTERSARAHKAHATKELMAEIRDLIAEHGMNWVRRRAVMEHMVQLGRAGGGVTPEDQAVIDKIQADWESETE